MTKHAPLLAVTVAALAGALSFSCHPAPKTRSDPKLEAEARAFAQRIDGEMRQIVVADSQAQWTNATDITDEHEAAAAATSAETMKFMTRIMLEAKQFAPILPNLDPATQRQIKLVRVAGVPAPTDPAKAQELGTIGPAMESAYGKGKACDDAGTCRDLGQLEDVLAQSRDPKELLDAWAGWHKVGREIKPLYVRYVELANEGARGVGFADIGELWRSRYDMPPDDFRAETERLWTQVKPLYQQLHCYTRRKLSEKYGKDVVPPDGPIPAHLLGNMWAQAWGNIYPMLEPYPGKAATDVSESLKEQGYDPARMVKLAEGFFVSLGLDPLPPTFWERSMLSKPPGKEVVCHASAWDVTYSDDLRIKMCIKINQDDLITIHHELGHDYYFHAYHTLPMLFQDGANDGFHEAIGDAIALSATPDYFVKMGLLKSAPKDEQAVINIQMQMALDKIAFLPFGMLVDRWRWDVFSGKTTPDHYNQRWWELRQELQGVAPPTARSEDDFDPGAKYHVPANVPYARYFLATILQFQFHRAMCRISGFKGPLHECSIYGSKEAGARLEAMLALGSSKPWTEALEALTGEKQMDATAILEYFAPLQKWLEEQNRGQKCGW